MDRRNLSINFLASWFGMAFATLGFSLFFFVYLSTARIVQPSVHNFKLYSALPQTDTLTRDEIEKEDGRAKIIEDFFRDYKSVLANYAGVFIQVADKYNLDYRLLPSIAMQESNGGRKVIENSFNPFGYGIYGDKVIRFASWEEAIEKVGKSLRENYLDKGLTGPDTIMSKYTPPAVKSGSWAKGVKSFMSELR